MLKIVFLKLFNAPRGQTRQLTVMPIVEDSEVLSVGFEVVCKTAAAVERELVALKKILCR